MKALDNAKSEMVLVKVDYLRGWCDFEIIETLPDGTQKKTKVRQFNSRFKDCEALGKHLEEKYPKYFNVQKPTTERGLMP